MGVCRPVYLHHLPQLLQQLGLEPDLAQPQSSHILLSTLVLLAPGILALGAHGLYELADALSAAVSGECSPRQKPLLNQSAIYTHPPLSVTLSV